MIEDIDELNNSIDNYVRIKVLGRGAFGEAVLYRKAATNELVVWKEISLERCSQANRESVDNEIEILSTLSHTNIIAFYNHFSDEKSIYIEMEFAEGGSLQHQISDRFSKQLFYTEEEVVWLYYQVLRGLNHMHSLNIMHRDLKTLNIFITRAGVCKLGDFGLSKVVEDVNAMADTVVGTPYYMSPELVKGERYNFKSDIWALGCVLHEILTLKKTFQATNTLKLAAMVVDGKVDPIDPDRYSEAMAAIVTQCLIQDPDDRPSTSELLYQPMLRDLPKTLDAELDELAGAVAKRRTNTRSSDSDQNAVDSSSKVNVSNTQAEVQQWGGSKAVPWEIVEFTGAAAGAIDVSAGKHHIAVVSVHKQLYTWTAENSDESRQDEGQLGNATERQCRQPRPVPALLCHSVRAVACGAAFTIALTGWRHDNSELFAFGSNYFGQLGVGNENLDQSATPLEVKALEDVPIVDIAAGDHHVLALSSLGQIYSWGCGEMGRLGLGDEDDRYHPCLLRTPCLKERARAVHAGTDTSFILSTAGHLCAFGCNEFNKLGLNVKIQGVQRQATVEETAQGTFCFDVPFETRPKLVKSLLRQKIAKISAGQNHTLVLEENGRVHAFGHNAYGQLGMGHTKSTSTVCRVRGGLSGCVVTCILAGDKHSLATVDDGSLFGWGSTEHARLLGDFESHDKILVPRKLFGSECRATRLAGYGWTTLMAAEKITSQRTLHVTSAGHLASQVQQQEGRLHVPPLGAGAPGNTTRDSGLGSSVASSFAASPPDVSVNNESIVPVPSWLKKELASGVSMSLSDSLSTQQLRRLSQHRQASINRPPELRVQQDLAAPIAARQLVKDGAVVKCTNCDVLAAQVDTLKAENALLRRSLDSKRHRIGLLESRLVSSSLHLPKEVLGLTDLVTEFNV